MNEKEAGLSRSRLVSEALRLVQEDGLDALSMRGLADRLHVKAASLYWHVRDRSELLELLAESILETVRPARSRPDWRSSVLDAVAALAERVAAQKDANRVLLDVPDSLTRSATYATLRRQLEAAGLLSAEASEVALMAMVHVIASQVPAKEPAVDRGAVASIAIDSGSRGVLLRPGSDMQELIRTAPDGASAAPAIVRGERVVVRRLRGVGYGEIELNPRHPWRFQIQGATWNTVLEIGGLDVRAIKLDSGAAKVDCYLPRPRGVVPIEVSGGVVGLSLHRPVAPSRSRWTPRQRRSIRSPPTFLWRRLESQCPRSRSCSTEWRAASTLVAKQSSETAIGRISGLVRYPLKEPDGVGVEVDTVGAAEPDAMAV